jgi:hypothetical protein
LLPSLILSLAFCQSSLDPFLAREARSLCGQSF